MKNRVRNAGLVSILGLASAAAGCGQGNSNQFNILAPDVVKTNYQKANGYDCTLKSPEGEIMGGRVYAVKMRIGTLYDDNDIGQGFDLSKGLIIASISPDNDGRPYEVDEIRFIDLPIGSNPELEALGNREKLSEIMNSMYSKLDEESK